MRNILNPKYEALMHEDIITPIHHHDDAQNHLIADIEGRRKVVTPEEAGVIVARYSKTKDLRDPSTECTHDGPKNAPGVSRRTLLQGAIAGFGIMAASSYMPRYAFAAEPTTNGKILVCIFLRGGFDGLSAMVPVTDSSYYKARPKIAVPENATTRVYGSNFGLNNHLYHPLKNMVDAKELALVVSAGNPNVSRSHFDDQVDMERAAPANMRSGWIGRYLAANSSQSGTFRALTMGNQAALSLSTNAFETLAMTNLGEFNIDSAWNDPFRSTMIKTVDAMYKNVGGKASMQMQKLLGSVAQLAPLRGSTYTPSNGAVYPDGPFGSSMRDVSRMIKANMGMEVACVDLGDWDMHNGLGVSSNPDDWFSRKARELGQGLAAMRADLGPRWNDVTVVTMSEFGRRVYENGDLGADHGHGNLMMIAGGGAPGGVYGSQPSLVDSNLVQGDVPITTDYRQVLSDMLRIRFGASNSVLRTVFPNYTPA